MRLSPPDAPWRKAMTTEEAREIAQIESEMVELRTKLHTLSVRRFRLQDSIQTRARYRRIHEIEPVRWRRRPAEEPGP